MSKENRNVNEALLYDKRLEQLHKSSEMLDDCCEAIELESFRADLHRMIDEVYEES